MSRRIPLPEGRDLVPVLVGGIVGALWMLVFSADAAYGDDCLQYVRRVSNFVNIPKGLLEDCMRTASVQAAVTGAIASVGGGVMATAIAKALAEAAAASPEPGLVPPPKLESPPGNKVFELDYCENCGRELPDEIPPGARCPSCGTRNALTTVGKCPGCGKFINMDSGECNCGATFKPPDNSAPPDAPPAPPKDSKQVFELDFCENCGAELPDEIPPGARCPSCGSQNLLTTVGKCPGCGRFINMDSGECNCGAIFRPPDNSPPSDKPNDAQRSAPPKACRFCGRPLQGVPPDGRCPACGAHIR